MAGLLVLNFKVLCGDLSWFNSGSTKPIGGGRTGIVGGGTEGFSNATIESLLFEASLFSLLLLLLLLLILLFWLVEVEELSKVN